MTLRLLFERRDYPTPDQKDYTNMPYRKDPRQDATALSAMKASIKMLRASAEMMDLAASYLDQGRYDEDGVSLAYAKAACAAQLIDASSLDCGYQALEMNSTRIPRSELKVEPVI